MIYPGHFYPDESGYFPDKLAPIIEHKWAKTMPAKCTPTAQQGQHISTSDLHK